MLVQAAIPEAAATVIIPRADRRDHRQGLVTRVAGDLSRAIEEPGAETAMLCCRPGCVAEPNTAPVDVELTNESALPELLHE